MRVAKRICAIILTLFIISTIFILSPIYSIEPAPEESNLSKLDKLGVLVYIPSDYDYDGYIRDTDKIEFSNKKISLIDIINIELVLTNNLKSATSFTGKEPNKPGEPLSFDHVVSIASFMKSAPAAASLGFKDRFNGNFAASPNNNNKYASTSTTNVPSSELYKALLIALGYKENIDFNYSNVLTYAAQSSVGFKNVLNVPSLNYSQLADIVYESLSLKKKNGEMLGQFVANNNAYFNSAAVDLGLVKSLFPSPVPVFNAGTFVKGSYNSQTLNLADGSGTYTEWEASYTGVTLASADAYKKTMSDAGWTVESVYDKTAGSTTERFFVFSKTVNAKSYFVVLSVNTSTTSAYLWVAL